VKALLALLLALLPASGLTFAAPAGNLPDPAPRSAADRVAAVAPRLRVDPRLLLEARTVWQVIGAPDNPVWPGWNATDTPILVYLPGVQDVLIHHPHPPKGFVRYPGRTSFERGAVYLRDGPTTFSWDGQNTSTEVDGVPTLVVADTPSRLKQQIRGLLGDPRPAETKLADLDYERDLVPDLYEEMATIAHEAFHVFQSRRAPNKRANERDVRLYPCLSVENNVGMALEGKALAECMRATDERGLRAAALRWLAVRRDRRRALPRPAVAYEDGNEFNEGLAKYVELAFMRALEGRRPSDSFFLYQGFHGFTRLAEFRDQRVRRMVSAMRGEVNVNNDPYGTSPIRDRLYYSGMAIATLLDRIAPSWKRRILADSVSLTDLAAEALRPTDAELRGALAEARSDTEYASIVAQKTKLAEDGRRDTDSLLARVIRSGTTALVLDYSALGGAKTRISFTPFGVRALDTLRTIYTMVPIAANVESNRNGFQQKSPIPTLEDRAAKTFTFPLERSLTAEEARNLTAAAERALASHEDFTAELPGAKVFAKRARVEATGMSLIVRCLPDE
jgi:hypothetical protein